MIRPVNHSTGSSVHCCFSSPSSYTAENRENVIKKVFIMFFIYIEKCFNFNFFFKLNGLFYKVIIYNHFNCSFWPSKEVPCSICNKCLVQALTKLMVVQKVLVNQRELWAVEGYWASSHIGHSGSTIIMVSVDHTLGHLSSNFVY